MIDYRPIVELSQAENLLSIQERFERFHHRNPHVYAHLVRLARQARRHGVERVGIELLWAVMRWQYLLETADPGVFKLNDHFTSRYARLILEREPELAGMFELRRLRAA